MVLENGLFNVKKDCFVCGIFVFVNLVVSNIFLYVIGNEVLFIVFNVVFIIDFIVCLGLVIIFVGFVVFLFNVLLLIFCNNVWYWVLLLLIFIIYL